MGGYKGVVVVGMADKGGASAEAVYHRYRDGFVPDPVAEAHMFGLAPRSRYSVNGRLYRLLLKDLRLYNACFKGAG